MRAAASLLALALPFAGCDLVADPEPPNYLTATIDGTPVTFTLGSSGTFIEGMVVSGSDGARRSIRVGTSMQRPGTYRFGSLDTPVGFVYCEGLVCLQDITGTLTLTEHTHDKSARGTFEFRGYLVSPLHRIEITNGRFRLTDD